MMLHAKYKSSSPYGLGQEAFYSFFFLLPSQLEFFTEFKSLKFSESASPKDHFCFIKICWPVSEEKIFLSNCSSTDGQTDAGR